MNRLVFSVFISLSVCFCVTAEICKDPKIETLSYTTTDGMVISDVAFVSEFTVSCQSGKRGYVLFADKKGNLIPAVKSADSSKYQISWTTNPETLYSGEYNVKVYDEEEYAAIKKAHQNNEDVSPRTSAFSLSLYHRGTYYGPWVSTEFIATVTSVLLCYIAYSARSNLMSS